MKIRFSGEEVRASVYPRWAIRPLPLGIFEEVPREEYLARARLLNNLPPAVRESLIEEMRDDLKTFEWLSDPKNLPKG